MAALHPTQKTIMVAMSGGVDSSVTAALLRHRGFAVVGAFMLLAQVDGQAQTERVRRVADRLGIPLRVVDLAAEFQRSVLDYFSAAYLAGRTPNPCVVCNRTIKFGLLREAGRQLGIEAMATGHYVRTAPGPEGRVRLLTGLDPKKDQSYFLSGLGQEQLAGLTFPLGETTKEEVYRIAADLGLGTLYGAESQDICFLQGQGLTEYFADLPARPGDIVTGLGTCLGRHQGLHLYTVGQRRGLGIPDSTPYYVIGLDPSRNQVIVGKEADLWRDVLTVREMRWTSGQEPALPETYRVKIRYRHQAAEAVVSRQGHGGHTIKFATAQRAITPGQFAVLYREDEVIGGGAID